MPERYVTWWSVVMRAVFAVAFAALLLDSLVTAVRWWRGELGAPTAFDWIEIALLPLLILVYLRYFSVLRPDCQVCAPSSQHSQSGHPGP